MSLSRSRAAVGSLGEVLITLGAVGLLFVVYLLVWTNVQAASAASAVSKQIEQDWSAASGGSSGSARESAGGDVAAPVDGEGFARLYVPRLREDVWGTPVVEGTAQADLARGIGHYVGSALPGEMGNFAVAAHRATHGEPFRNIDQLVAGDLVIVETAESWVTYRLDNDEIVTPRDTWVVGPVPGQPGATPSEALITLTTCHPRWGSSERWIWWGSLIETVGRDGPPPAGLGED